MWILQAAIEFTVDMLRTLLIEGIASRVRAVARRPRLRGMKAVHRHVRSRVRRRLFNRLSTGWDAF
jgi:hypothetical protein